MSHKQSIDGMVVRPQAASTKLTNTKSKSFLHTVAWLGMLFVIGSIAFSSYMVYFGTDNAVAKLIILPQVIFAAGVAIYKFAFNK